MRPWGILMLAGITLLPGCAKKNSADQSAAIVSESLSYAKSMQRIYGLMSSKPTDTPPKPVDFDAIEKVYRGSLAPLVAAYGQPLASEIDSAIVRGKRNENIPIQKQWLDKGMQQVIYHTALKELDRAPGDSAAHARATDLIQCLGTVMDRRAKWYNPGAGYKDQVNFELTRMKGASPEQAQQSAVVIKDVLKRVYLLSLIWEMRGLVASRGKGENEPAMKKIEGMIYYNVFAPAISDSVIRNTISGEWQKDPLEINVETIKSNLAKGVPELWNELPDSIKKF